MAQTKDLNKTTINNRQPAGNGRRNLANDFQFVLKSVRALSANNRQQSASRQRQVSSNLPNNENCARESADRKRTESRATTTTTTNTALAGRNSSSKSKNYDDELFAFENSKSKSNTNITSNNYLQANNDDNDELELSAELRQKLIARRKSIEQSNRIENLKRQFEINGQRNSNSANETYFLTQLEDALVVRPAGSWRDKSTVILNVKNSKQQARKSAVESSNSPPTFGSVSQRVAQVGGHSGGPSPAFALSSSSSESSLSKLVVRENTPSIASSLTSKPTTPSYPILTNRQLGLSNSNGRTSRSSTIATAPLTANKNQLPPKNTNIKIANRSTSLPRLSNKSPKEQHQHQSSMNSLRRHPSAAMTQPSPRRWPSVNYGNAANLSRRPASAAPAYQRSRKSPSLNLLQVPTYGLHYADPHIVDYPAEFAGGELYAPLSQQAPLSGYSRLASKSSHALGPTSVAADEFYYADHPFADRRAPASAYYSPMSPPLSPPHYLPGSTSRPLYVSSRFGMLPPASARPLVAQPAAEHLRRNFNYQHQQASLINKPVHLHPQWAFSRPFAHLRAPDEDDYETDPDADDDNLNRRSGNENEFDDDDASSAGGERRPALRLRRPNFVPFNRFEDSNVVRACDWHPSGDVYAIGSNSKTLRICAYPAEHELRNFNGNASASIVSSANAVANSTNVNNNGTSTNIDAASIVAQAQSVAPPPRVLFKFLHVHRGSIYCAAFNSSGGLLATGSNDQTIRFWRYNSLSHSPEGDGYRLSMHNGTVRDFCFVDDHASNSSLLLSAGGGDNKIYVTDCESATPFQSFAGHTAMIMSLSQWGGATFVSGSHDKTIRFWDLRTRTCTSIVSAPSAFDAHLQGTVKTNTSRVNHNSRWASAGPGAAVCAVKVDPTGRLLVSGHADATCMLYDIRAARVIQTFKQHDDEVRSLSLSAKAFYLLTGSYDGKLMLTDLQGDLTQPLPTSCVSNENDKVIQAKWHPQDFTFLACCANKSATLWALPQR